MATFAEQFQDHYAYQRQIVCHKSSVASGKALKKFKDNIKCQEFVQVNEKERFDPRLCLTFTDGSLIEIHNPNEYGGSLNVVIVEEV